MPNVGEIKRSREIGRGGSGKFVWQACMGCRKERWVSLKLGMPSSLRCHKCGNWQKGLTKETDYRLAEKAERMRGRTKETHSYLAESAKKLSEKMRGRTKETHPSVAAQAGKMRGRTKETHPYLAVKAEKMRGRTGWNKGLTKETDSRVARIAEGLCGHRAWNKGLTKETHPGIEAGTEKMSKKLRGRTKETHPYLAENARKLSEKMRGRTKETHPYLIAKAEKMCGRITGVPAWNKGLTKESHPSILTIAEKNRGKIPWNKSLTKETHPSLAIVGKKTTGELNGSWRGGLSSFPYTPTFNNTLKEMIRQRDGYRCQRCGVPQTECTRKLDIHHIDYDKQNTLSGNLISLCRACNSNVNFNRKFWTKHFQILLEWQSLTFKDTQLESSDVR